MKIFIINTGVDDPKFSREINNANPAFVPRIGDKVDVGYKPFPVVKSVVWEYDKNEVFVQIE